MSIWLPIICLIYGIPFLAILISITRLFIQYRTRSLISLALFVFCFVIWSYSSLFWQLDLNAKEETVHYLFTIGVISASLGLIILMTFFSRAFITYKVKILAKIAIIIYLVLIGISIASLVDPNNEFYNLKKEGEDWKAAYHPFIFLIINMGYIFFLGSFLLGVKDLNSLPEHLMEPRNKKINKFLAITLVTTMIINSLFFALDPIYGLISRFVFLFFIMFFAYYLAHDPVMIFFGLSNTRKMIEEGYIGFVLSAITQLGPSPIYSSDKFNERFDIEASEIITNSVLSLTVTNACEDLTESVFMIPFAKKSNIRSINISFSLYDSTFDDPRHNQMNICVISVLVPYFNVRVKSTEKIKTLIQIETKKIPELSDLTEEVLVEIVNKILKSLCPTSVIFWI